jgi:hypothetical protein
MRRLNLLCARFNPPEVRGTWEENWVAVNAARRVCQSRASFRPFPCLFMMHGGALLPVRVCFRSAGDGQA